MLKYLIDLIKQSKITTADRELHIAYKNLFKTPDGEKVLQDIIVQGNVLKSNMNATSTETTAYYEGKRALALRILTLAKSDLGISSQSKTIN